MNYGNVRLIFYESIKVYHQVIGHVWRKHSELVCVEIGRVIFFKKINFPGGFLRNIRNANVMAQEWPLGSPEGLDRLRRSGGL
jgi:hypothetical protein